MADWTDQITQFQRSCMDQQQKMLSGWFTTLPQGGYGAPQNVWRQAIDTLEQQVNSVLDTQQQSFKALSKTLEQAGSASPEMSPWGPQVEAGMSFWMNMQKQLWKMWFDMLRNATPARQEPGEMLAQNWQDMVKQAVNMQQQWLSSLTGGQSWTKGPSGKK